MGDIINSTADLFGLGPASKQAEATTSAAQTSANAQLAASQMAADAARFRPVGVTSRFGASQFGFDPSGVLSSASYTLSPELQQYQNYLSGQTQAGLGDTSRLLSLGRQYISETPEQVAQKYMESQQALLAPSREQQSANLMNQLSNTGRTGLSIAQGGNLGMSNPEYQALANARALQDLQLAAQATQAGQQQYTFGQGLLSSAYSPLQSQLGTAATLEQLGQSPLDIGAQLGGRSATYGANVGNTLLQGGLASARTAQAGNAYSPFGSAVSGLASNKAFGSGVGNYLNAYGNSLQANQQYGAGNVYGYGGGGQQPSQSVWGNMFNVEGGV